MRQLRGMTDGVQRLAHLIQHEASRRAGPAARGLPPLKASRRAGPAPRGLAPWEAVAGHEAGGVRLGGPPAHRAGAVVAPGVIHRHIQHPAALVRGSPPEPKQARRWHHSPAKVSDASCDASMYSLTLLNLNCQLGFLAPHCMRGPAKQEAPWQESPER